MPTSSTTLTSWALLIWKLLLVRGLDAHSIFKQAGLDHSKLGDGNARYRVTDMYKLWELSVQQSNDPTFGFEVGKTWAPTTFHALGFAWLASNSLKDALARFTLYTRVVNNALSGSLEEHGPHLHFILSTSENLENIHTAARDAGLAALLTMCKLICGESFTPVELNLARKRNQSADKLEALAGISIKFESDKNVMVIDSMLAEQRLASGNSELARLNEDVALKYLNLLDRNSVDMRVKAALIDLMPSGHVSEEAVSSKLSMSVRTLQRKLSEDKTSFSLIYKAIRQEMANAYLQNSQMSITEISYLLGFSEQANFTRAYKKWYGTSPSVARENIQSSSFV